MSIYADLDQAYPHKSKTFMTLWKAIEMTHANRDRVVSVNALRNPKNAQVDTRSEQTVQTDTKEDTAQRPSRRHSKRSHHNKDETTADPKEVGTLPLHHIRTNIKVASPYLLQTWFFLRMTYRYIKNKIVQSNQPTTEVRLFQQTGLYLDDQLDKSTSKKSFIFPFENSSKRILGALH